MGRRPPGDTSQGRWPAQDRRLDYHLQRSPQHAVRSPTRTIPPIYTTCLTCHADLGRNESLELFPVGRRIAFDQAKGRLWVICTACSRWNLSPLDERWEVIEACERRYHDTRKRVATDQIGLAKVDDGLALVRIGKPVFPEYASWRYGERFTKRYRREFWVGGAVTAAAVTSIFAGPAALAALGISGGGFGFFFYNAITGTAKAARERKHLGGVTDTTDRKLRITGADAEAARIITRDKDQIVIELEGHRTKAHGHEKGGPLVRIAGADAQHFLRMALPVVNRAGTGSGGVDLAIKTMGLADGPVDPVRSAHAVLTKQGYAFSLLREMPVHLRVGFEMAVMEDQERRWLESELYLLSTAWKEAEELAAIADELTVPAWIQEKVNALRGKGT